MFSNLMIYLFEFLSMLFINFMFDLVIKNILDMAHP